MLTDARILHLIVYVHDLPSSVEFYHQRLGLPLLWHDHDQARLDAGGLEIWPRRAAEYDVTLVGPARRLVGRGLPGRGSGSGAGGPGGPRRVGRVRATSTTVDTPVRS